MQSKIDYGLSIWGCTAEANLDRIQRIQNVLARIMCNNVDYINLRGIEMVRPLGLHTISERRDHFLCILMFKWIHGLAPHYLCNDVTMYIVINGYDTRNAENMYLYLSRCLREIYKRSFLYKCLWNELPSCLRESISIIDFKRNYRLLYGWRLSWLLMPLCECSIFYMKPRHVDKKQFRISTSNIYFYPALVFISSFIWGSFIYDLYLYAYICVIFCVYILFCNRSP